MRNKNQREDRKLRIGEPLLSALCCSDVIGYYNPGHGTLDKLFFDNEVWWALQDLNL
jgi:hypothetical protein